MLRKYKRKPIIVEAIQYNGKNSKEILKLVPNSALRGHDIVYRTLDGTSKIRIGEYVIKKNDEFFSIPEEIFKKEYDPLNTDFDS